MLFCLDYLVLESRFLEYLYSRLGQAVGVKTTRSRVFDHAEGSYRGTTFRMQCVFNKVTRETRILKDIYSVLPPKHHPTLTMSLQHLHESLLHLELFDGRVVHIRILILIFKLNKGLILSNLGVFL